MTVNWKRVSWELPAVIVAGVIGGAISEFIGAPGFVGGAIAGVACGLTMPSIFE
jgi:hypothetical protein